MHDQSTISSNIPFDLRLGEKIEICTCADTRHHYFEKDPCREHARALPVVITPVGIAHLSDENPKRVDWLMERPHLILRALQDPEIVYRNLIYKDKIDHWSQFFAVRDEKEPRFFVSVIVTLARIVNTTAEAEYHQVITMFNADEMYLFRRVAGGLELKPKFMRAK